MITKHITTIALIVLVGLTASAKPCKKQSTEDLVKTFAEAFAEKRMANVDQAFIRRIRFVIEHSLADDDNPKRFEVRTFTSLARAEKWLKSREIEGMPGRHAMPLVKCARGVCTYNFDGGILHNNLYLKKITYGLRGRCPYIKTVYILDGD